MNVYETDSDVDETDSDVDETDSSVDKTDSALEEAGADTDLDTDEKSELVRLI